LAESYGIRSDHISSQLLVYRIRAKAAKEAVPLTDLGRALFHLAKRRGFNSNLRGVPKKDEDEGLIKSSIKTLANELQEKGVTLGEYFADANPFENRVRARWTGRDMFLHEFDTIWKTQSQFHPQLTEIFYRKLRKAIFYQRPLRSAKGLVGKCSIYKKKRRLVAAHPLAQEVRMLQFLNNVLVTVPGNDVRQLTREERQNAIDLLSNCEKLTIKQFRESLGLPKKSKLNFDSDDDTHAHGLGTSASIRAIIGDQWDSLDATRQEKLIHELLSFNKRDALIKHLVEKWTFAQANAELLADLTLEPGYANHSRKALEELREILLTADPSNGRWLTYAEAKKIKFPDNQVTDQFERLPPIREALSGVTNPTVIRALTEVRKVVNELIERYGIPDRVRIELSRDLKKSKKERKKIEDLVKEQTKTRKKALGEIRKEFSAYPEKAGYDRGIEMVLLAEECNWMCPYTGESITSVQDLLGDNSRFDIEHIYPRRFLDNSFSNKTLCLNQENRNVKRDRLPSEAYSADANKYQEILDRVRRFKGPAASRKLERFLATEVPKDFINRQLDETRYMSRAAADYLGLLFGGRVDEQGRQRVFTVTGGLTAILRNQWKLNQILGLADEKNRADHRHHAIDAIVIACTDSSTVQALQLAASQGWASRNSRNFDPIEPPFSSFFEDCRKSILGVFVSFKPTRKLNGLLHADSLYSVKQNPNGRYDIRLRKRVTDLTENMIENIVDESVKKAVRKRLQELASTVKSYKKPGDLFTLDNHPYLESANGNRTPIHSVRIWETRDSKDLTLKKISKGNIDRYAGSKGGSNYCLRIYGVFNKSGELLGWKDRLLTRLEAMELYRKKESKKHKSQSSTVKSENVVHPDENAPIAAGEFNEEHKLFDLFINDYVLANDKHGNRALCRILSISEGDIELRIHNDGRRSEDVKKSDDRFRIRRKLIQNRGFQKVTISPAGLLRDAATNEIIYKIE
jgi:CRISPR-associated endonuclease Csn1